MKKYKSLISILLACSLIFSLTLCAFAEDSEPMPYIVDFGDGEWTIGDTTVYSVLLGKRISGVQYLSGSAAIGLDNFDGARMRAEVAAEDGFSVFLAHNGDNEVSLNRPEVDCNIPYDISFRVVAYDGDENHDAREYSVNFGTASWEVNGVTVTASMEDKDLTDGAITVYDFDEIKLSNFDSLNMQIKVYSKDGFTAFLVADSNTEVSFGRVEGNLHLPDELNFIVEPYDDGQHLHFDDHGDDDRVFSVDFRPNAWVIGGSTITVSVGDKDLTNGPVEVLGSEIIKINNPDDKPLQARVYGDNSFAAFLEINGDNEVNLARVEGPAHLPDCTFKFAIEPYDENAHQYEEGPEEPPHEEGTYMVDFVNARWEIGDVTVSAKYGDVDLQVGAVEVSEDEPITLTGFDKETMRVRVEGANHFGTSLDVNDDGTVYIKANDGTVLPYFLRFVVEEIPENPYPLPEGIEVSLTDDKVHYLETYLIDYMHLVGEGIAEQGFTEESYEETKAVLREVFKESGDLIYLFEIHAYEDGNEITNTPLYFEIPITQDLADGEYESARFVGINRNDNGEFYPEYVTNFRYEVMDDKLICVIPNGGVYALTASKNSALQGDINRDGEVSIIDVVMARAHIVGNSELGMYQIADGDMNGDNAIDIVDVAMMRNDIINVK